MESLRPVGQSGAHPVVIGMETCASGSQSFDGSSACSGGGIQIKSRSHGQPRNDGFRNLLVVVIVVVSEWGTCSGALMVDKDVTHMESLRLMVSLEKPLYSTVRGQPLKPLYNQGCLGPASPIRRRLWQ